MVDDPKARRKILGSANEFQGKIVRMVSLAVAVPVAVTILSLFFLIFSIVAAEVPNREILTFNIVPAAIKVFIFIVIMLPASIILILLWTYKISNRLVGPLGRLYTELDKRIATNGKEHILFRKGDDLEELAHKINKILDRLP
jgi:hypothetical protein